MPDQQRPWDARLASRLVTPLKHTVVTPNHLTTVRRVVGIAAAAAFLPGTYGWSNVGALAVVLSNFIDHTDGELARLSGKTSRIGHLYDLASDAIVTILLFIAMGVGVGASLNPAHGAGASAALSLPLLGWPLKVPPAALGALAGIAVALIFFLRMRIEDMAGKNASRQAAFGGFETEDILYLLPLVTLCDGETLFVIAASIGAPLFALWVIVDYRRMLQRQPA